MGAGVVLVVGVKVVVMVENREAAEAVPAEAVPAEAAVAEAVEGTEQGTARFEVGVGPWEGPWPEGDHWDEELLREGDRRNVVDKYRYWSMDAIIADLDTRRHDFHVAIENWQHDLNIGTVVRTANAMLAKEVHIIGRRRWNRRGAMVTDRYQHVRHHPTIEDFVAWAQAEGLEIIGIDIFQSLKQTLVIKNICSSVDFLDLLFKICSILLLNNTKDLRIVITNNSSIAKRIICFSSQDSGHIFMIDVEINQVFQAFTCD